ncbi:hypothetical protein FQR65_LT15421 [Abscondita terminalis]|nr:hypothetical protein FQR65_LT15421 [Abscondita terminalis]
MYFTGDGCYRSPEGYYKITGRVDDVLNVSGHRIGIIDHETGTRDLSKLQGLRKVLLPVAVAGLLASLSSAGMPLTLGFIGKDLIYDATLKFDTQLALFVTIAAVVTNIGLVAAGFMAGIKPFAGKLPDQFKDLHLPYKSIVDSLRMILAILGLLLGIYPKWIGDILTQQTASSILPEMMWKFI